MNARGTGKFACRRLYKLLGDEKTELKNLIRLWMMTKFRDESSRNDLGQTGNQHLKNL